MLSLRQISFPRRVPQPSRTLSASFARRSSSRSVFVPELAASFPHRWLRDSCQCPACVHPSTRQKLHASSDVPLDVRLAEASFAGGALHVTWAAAAAPDPAAAAPHKSVYPLDWLRTYATPQNRRAFHRDMDRVPWTPATLRAAPHLFVDYAPLQEPAPRLAALAQLLRYGLIFVRGVPPDRTDDAGCELRRLVSVFGKLRHTFYGEVWDVRNVANSANIAYTNLNLGLHMDLLYFQNPPHYQILHCLRNNVSGGTSQFVDAFHVAGQLSPDAHATLANTAVPFHYVNDGHHLHQAHPTIALAPFSPTPRIEHINYAPPFQAPLPPDTPDSFYDALAAFARLLETDKFEYTLQEGDAVIFDNRRVLHARTAFHEIDSAEGGTTRWLKGCYFEEDDMLDQSRVLGKALDQ